MASVWINKRYVNCDATIRRRRKTIRFHITPELKRNHQWIRDLFNEMEKAAKTNTRLSDQSIASLRRIKQFDPDTYQIMEDLQWFANITDFTLEKHSQNITLKEREGKASRTISNWKNTAKRLFLCPGLQRLFPNSREDKLIWLWLTFTIMKTDGAINNFLRSPFRKM